MSKSKRKSQMLLDSDDSDSNGSGSGTDLEKEMLSLAKKKTQAPVTKRIKQESDSDSSDSDSDWGASKSKKSSSKRSGRKHAKQMKVQNNSSDSDDSGEDRPPVMSEEPVDPKPKNPEDLEEGEVSSSEGSEGSSDEFNDGYDEQLLGDEEDQKRMSLMTEREREQELFTRMEAREKLKTRWEIERKLKQARRKELKKQRKSSDVRSLSPNSTSPSASTAESVFNKMDVKERSKERKKIHESKIDKKSQAMDALKARREDQKARAEAKEKLREEEEKKRTDDKDDDIGRGKDDAASTVSSIDKAKRKLKAEDVYSDDSDGSDWNEDRKPVQQKKKSDSDSRSSDSEDERDKRIQYVDRAADLNRIRLSRMKFEKWVHLPFFSKVAKGCFVRVGIGQQAKSNLSLYRVAEIMEVVDTSKVYQLGPTKTNKGIRLRHGDDEKTFRLEFVSNADFTQEEFERWLLTCRKDEIALPTMDEVQRKEKEIKEANNYQIKEEDIELIIQEKQKFKQAPINFAMKKTALMKEREMALMNGDEDRAGELAKLIAEIDERAEELNKARTSSISSISYINERNRKKNVEEAEKAIMEEHKANKGLKIEDPFTRRNTKPSRPSVHKHGAAEIKSEVDTKPELTEEETSAMEIALLGNLLNGTRTEDGSQDSLTGNSEDLVDSKPPSGQILSTGDLFSAHDFDIKLDLDAKLPHHLPIVPRPTITPIREPAPKRSLNLEDYKRKRGLI